VKPFAEVTNLFSEAGIQFVYFFYLFVFVFFFWGEFVSLGGNQALSSSLWIYGGKCVGLVALFIFVYLRQIKCLKDRKNVFIIRQLMGWKPRKRGLGISLTWGNFGSFV